MYFCIEFTSKVITKVIKISNPTKKISNYGNKTG